MPTLTVEHEDCGLAMQVLSGIQHGLSRYADENRPINPRVASLPQAEWNRRYLPDHFIKQYSALHLWACGKCDELRQRRGQRVNLIGPRGGAKSTILNMAHALRCAVEGIEPLIWIVSETGDLAEQHLEHIRTELTDNTSLAHDYPRACGRGSTWRVGGIRLRNGVAIEAFGTGQKIRGRRKRSNRPTLIICDDIQSDRVMTSADARQKDRIWFEGSLLKAGTKRTNFINLATALHREALGLELTRRPGWQNQVFRSIIRWPTNMSRWEEWSEIYHDIETPGHEQRAYEFFQAHLEEMTADADVLWPDEEDLYTLMRIREEDRNAFEREKQSRAVNPEQSEWPEEYFGDHIWYSDDEQPRDPIIKVMMLDPSKGKDAKRSDYSAFVMLAVDRHKQLYVDADLKRRSVTDIVEDGCELYRTFRPTVFGVEANAWQDLLGAEFESALMRWGVLNPSISLLDNHTKKQVRIRRLGPLLSQRRIKFKRGSPGVLLLISQMKDFPDPKSHDDGPDALEMATRLASAELEESDEAKEWSN